MAVKHGGGRQGEAGNGREKQGTAETTGKAGTAQDILKLRRSYQVGLSVPKCHRPGRDATIVAPDFQSGEEE